MYGIKSGKRFYCRHPLQLPWTTIDSPHKSIYVMKTWEEADDIRISLGKGICTIHLFSEEELEKIVISRLKG